MKWLLSLLPDFGDAGFAVALLAAMFAFVGASWVGGSYMEARAYERVTGQHVSTLDAMFLDLRVQSAPKP